VEGLLGEMRKRGIATYLGQPVKGFTAGSVITGAGEPPVARPRPELICILDSLNAGTLVYRDARRSWVLPSLRPMHWAKPYFERHYLRGLR